METDTEDFALQSTEVEDRNLKEIEITIKYSENITNCANSEKVVSKRSARPLKQPV